CRPCSLRLQRFHNYTREAFHAGAICIVETRELRAVDVPDTNQRCAGIQRHDNLRTRCGITGNMARESVHVAHHLRLPRLRGHAAHAFAERDAHTGRPALEWTDDEFVAIEEIEPGP